MSLYIVIFILIVLFTFKDYHRTVLFYAPLRMIIHPGICLRYESPILQLDFACCFLFTVFSFFSGGHNKDKVLLRLYFIFFISFVIAIFSSYFDVFQAAPSMIGKIFILYYSYLFYKELKRIGDIKFFSITYFVLMVIMIGYGLYEYVLQSNPVMDFESSMFPEELKNLIYATSIRLESIRCQSFTNISITYGSLCVIWLSFLFLFRSVNKSFIPLILWILLFALILFSTFTSGSKSPFIFFICFFGAYIFFSKENYFFRLVVIIISVVLLFVFNSYFYDFYLQIVDSSKSSTAGSDIPMRLMQVDAASKVLDAHSWLFGLGAKGVYQAQLLNPLVLGAESIWLQLLLEQGIIGCLAYILFFVCFILYAKRSMDTDSLLLLKIFVFSWIVLNTVSSLPGLDLSFFLCLCFVFIKANHFAKIK